MSQKNKSQPNFSQKIGDPAYVLQFLPFDQIPACNLDWTYRLTLVELKSIEDKAVSFDQLIKNNPANEGSMPTGLGRLEKQSVYIKTGDSAFQNRCFVAFVSGTLAKNLVYPDQPQFKQNFELVRFKVINPTFLVANHPPVITDYGLYLIVSANEQKNIKMADVFDLGNI